MDEPSERIFINFQNPMLYDGVNDSVNVSECSIIKNETNFDLMSKDADLQFMSNNALERRRLTGQDAFQGTKSSSKTRKTYTSLRN
jgi:hypothetical protein